LETGKGGDTYTLRKSELEAVLGPFETSGIMSLLRQYLASQEDELEPYREEIPLDVHRRNTSPSRQQEM
jgi:hypothetical protein